MGMTLVAAWVAEAITSFAVNALISVATNFIISAFTDVPDQQEGDFQSQATGRQQAIRSAIVSRRIIYGQARVSGPIVYARALGSSGELFDSELWLVIVLADHEVEAIDDIYFNDIAITNDQIDVVTGIVSHPSFLNGAWIFKHLGGAGQTVDAALAAVDPLWTADHRGDGTAYIVVHLHFSTQYYPGGIPNISALVRGKKLYDPRDAGTRYSANWALVARDYLTDSTYGLSCAAAEIGDASFIAAANVCDERVLMPTAGSPASAALSATVTFVGSGINHSLGELLQTGDGVRFTTTGALPSPLVAGTTYYWVRASSGVGWVAASFANAYARSIIALSGGSGAQTVNYYDQVRYDAQGVLDSGAEPMRILKELVTAAAGTLVFQQGAWRCYAGAYRSPSGALTADDLRGPIKVGTAMTRKQLFNGIRGTYVNPANGYQAGDFPIYKSAAYATQDGGEILRDIELPYTTNSFRAQRLAKIAVEKSRNSITLAAPCKYTAFQYAIWDNVPVTIAQLGWTAKEFSVLRWLFNPAGGVDLQLQEEAAGTYTWTGSDATVIEPPADVVLPDPLAVDAISGLALTSGTADLFIAGDGTVHSRIHAAWTVSDDGFVLDGGAIELQYALAAGSPQIWLAMPDAPGAASEAYITGVNDATAYDVRVRARNSLGAVGAWAYVYGHTVVGKTALPSDVTGFSAQQNGTNLNFQWTQVSDIDLAGYEIRYRPLGNTTWAGAPVITSVTRGTAITNGFVPPGSWTLLLKARDTSLNYSQNAASFNIAVASDNNIITSNEQAPDWLGAKVNYVKHWTGKLVPDSQSLASAADWEIFDQAVYNPYATCEYTATELDGQLDDLVRVWASSVQAIAPGESGALPPELYVDARLAAGSYDGFEPWGVGNVEARYVSAQLVEDTSGGIGILTSFIPTMDGEDYVQHGEALTVAAGGTAVAFSPAFHATPNVQVTADASGSPTASVFGVYADASATGFTAHVLNASGVSVGGVINWTAQGY